MRILELDVYLLGFSNLLNLEDFEKDHKFFALDVFNGELQIKAQLETVMDI